MRKKLKMKLCTIVFLFSILFFCPVVTPAADTNSISSSVASTQNTEDTDDAGKSLAEQANEIENEGSGVNPELVLYGYQFSDGSFDPWTVAYAARINNTDLLLPECAIAPEETSPEYQALFSQKEYAYSKVGVDISDESLLQEKLMFCTAEYQEDGKLVYKPLDLDDSIKSPLILLHGSSSDDAVSKFSSADLIGKEADLLTTNGDSEISNLRKSLVPCTVLNGGEKNQLNIEAEGTSDDGSILFTKNGDIAGIMISYTEGGGTAYTASYIMSLLSEAGVSFSATEETSSGNPYFSLLLFGLLAFLIILGIVFFLLANIKKKNMPQEEGEKGQTLEQIRKQERKEQKRNQRELKKQQQKQEKEKKKGKKKEQLQDKEQNDEIQNPSERWKDNEEDSFDESTTVLHKESKPSFRLRRKKTGQIITVDHFPFRIGKNKGKVDYCITDNSTISRVHCILTEDGGKFFLSDNESTNGTFLNGQMLTSGETVKIRKGDRIRLSDEEFDLIG